MGKRLDCWRKALDQAYADAMADAARAFPNDDTVQVLFAEALMDLSPWDYWEAGGARPKARSADMIAALERVLERNPTHPGAAHYYIHAMEASTRPDKALPYARTLARQIPGAGHIVHMPSHIYYRVGLYKEALQSNLDAIAADERYFRRAESDPVYKGAYYPHNIHFVMVSALMGGDGKTALQAIPAALGAILARHQLTGAKTNEASAAPGSTYAGELFLMSAGALFVAFNVAPTEEMILISFQMDLLQTLVLAALSIALLHLVVFSLGFAGQEAHDGQLRALAHFTVPGYAIALLVSLYVLWTFGRTDGLSPHEIVSTMIVLGFPAALGAALARLVV